MSGSVNAVLLHARVVGVVCLRQMVAVGCVEPCDMERCCHRDAADACYYSAGD